MRISDWSSDVCSSDLPAADQPAHQHRNQRDREYRGRGHRIGFGECERREESPFLALEREDRDEREGDDEEAEEERRPNFGGGLGDHAPRSEEHTSELQSLMRISYAVFCLKKTRL